MADTHALFDRANELHSEIENLEQMVADLAFDVSEYSKEAHDNLLEAQASLNTALEHIFAVHLILLDATPLLRGFNG
jgi:hypothetical protein